MNTVTEKERPFLATQQHGFESKIIRIFNDEMARNEYNNLTNENAKYSFITNHFIMSDIETREIRAYILRYGLSYFINSMEGLLSKIVIAND